MIGGAGSYGALLTGTVFAHEYPVAEASWIEAKRHPGRGKSDTLDTRRIATAVLALPVSKLRRPRLNNGVRQALQVLVTAQSAMTKDCTRSVNALTALVRRHALGVDARKALRGAQISNIARWRARKEELAVAVARAEAHRLAKYIVTLDDQLRDNDQLLTDLVTISEAASLLQRPRVGMGCDLTTTAPQRGDGRG